MARINKRYLKNYLMIMARKVRYHTIKVTPSKNLRESMSIDASQLSMGKVTIGVPHFWAPFVHEGVGPVHHKRMVWFDDPKQDPRLQPRRPIKRSDVKRLHLSPGRFRYLVHTGQLIVAWRRRGIPGRPFFKWGLLKARPSIRKILGQIERDFNKEIHVMFGQVRISLRP